MPEISVAEAAKRLGIGEQRVRALAADGSLAGRRVGRAWLIDSSAVDGRRRGVRPGRPLSARSAWALLLLLAGRDDEMSLHRSERARAAARAARVLDLEPRALARRAHALWRFAHPAAIARLADDARVVLTGPSAESHHGAALIGPGPLELYVRDRDVPVLDREYGLLTSDASEANVLLRVPNDLWPFQPGERVVPSVVLAADLIDRGDERSVRSGRALLSRAQAART